MSQDPPSRLTVLLQGIPLTTQVFGALCIVLQMWSFIDPSILAVTALHPGAVLYYHQCQQSLEFFLSN